MRIEIGLGLFLSGALMMVTPGLGSAEATDTREFFETRIRPVLANNCFACHTNSKLGGLQLDSREHLLKGGNSGAAIVPGKPEESLLIRAVNHTHERLKMPLGSKLKDQEVADLTAWVGMGAPWPEGGKQNVAQSGEFKITAEQRAFWAFQPIKKPVLPSVKIVRWAKSPVDLFILSRLEAEGLEPVRAADKRTLLRRASFDLIGLPPTPAEMDAFLSDHSTEAFAKVVDRLLASPHYGERWGRHWLDVARYSEDDVRSAAPARRELYPNAWRYRDWVVSAFNKDVPYNLFAKAQIAGDLLDKQDPTAELGTRLTPATGLFGLGPWYYDTAEAHQARADERNDRVDVVTRGFLGLTVACARCHDHKYDPISMRDYYALAGVFAGTEYAEYPLVPQQVVAEFKNQQKRIKDHEAAIREFTEEQAKQLANILARQTSRYMVAAWKTLGPLRMTPAKIAEEERLDQEALERWVKYLGSPQKDHPYLSSWDELLAEGGTVENANKVASDFQKLVLEIIAEQREVDEKNLPVVMAEAKRKRKAEDVLLPNSFMPADEDREGALVAIERDKFVLWSDLFLEQGLMGELSKTPGVLVYKDEKLDRFLSGEWKRHLDSMRAELESLKTSLPARYPYTHGIGEAHNPGNLRLHLRGSPTDLAEDVPRRFLAILSDGEPTPFRKGSGRLELAEAIVRHPLTARVMVNRIWSHHFGQGIVGTPSNFGQLGARPTHPELLEYLTERFITKNWSMKAIHREIMLSATYQLSSEHDEANANKDADNRLYWRANLRQLDVEALRDSLLFVTGTLDTSIGGPSAELNQDHKRRTIYATISRLKLNGTLARFDFPDASVTNEQRNSTNVPIQRLFFLNSSFIWRQAELLANRLSADGGNEVSGIGSAYRLLYGRDATKPELRLGIGFLENARKDPSNSSTAWQRFAQVLLSTNEFIFLD